MTTVTKPVSRRTPARRPACLLRWILRNGNAAIVCEVETNRDGSLELRVRDFWSPANGFVERFDRATAALERHAEVAGALRDAGWAVTDRLNTERPAAA